MGLFDQLKALKLLLVDDAKWVRDSLKLFLKCEGCHILGLTTTEEGLEIQNLQTFDAVN